MKATLGQMPNAPLALVLAQVAFSPYLSISQRIAAIQDELRKEYPQLRKGELQTIEINASGIKTTKAERWEFADSSNREGFIVQQNALIFHATNYDNYEGFARRLGRLLEAFERLVPDVLVERLGLRYVDIIVPGASEAPEEFVVAGLRGCPLERLEPKRIQTQHVTVLTMGEGTFVFRYSRGIDAPYMPDDLQPMPLDLPEIVERAKRASSDGAIIGLLDFDRILPMRSTYKATELSERFRSMHQDHSIAFRCAQSEHAGRVWNDKV